MENFDSIKQLNQKQITWSFIITVLLIYPLPQLAIDIYLPSWPAMVNALHTSNTSLQLSLTVYILFLGIAQLIYGPISDRFGRKPPLLFGCALFFLSSVACLFIHSMEQLLFLRALQGLGIGCGFAIASAILSDVFAGEQLARYTSFSAMVYSLAIICAPVIGGYLQHYFGWRANFMVMVVYSLVLYCLIYFTISETKTTKDKNALIPKKIVSNYFFLLVNPYFVWNVFCLTLSYGIMIVINIIGPFLFQDVLHLTEITYGNLLLLMGFSYFLGASVNSAALKRWNTSVLIIVGLSLMTVGSVGLFFIDLLDWVTLGGIVFFMCIALFGVGFVFPNCFANALNVFPGKGAVGSFIGSMGLLGTSLISIIVSNWHVKYMFCLSCTFVVIACLAWLCYLSAKCTAARADCSMLALK